MDVATSLSPGLLPVACFQETKLPEITCPKNFTMVHQAQEGKGGGGIATLVPKGVHIVRTTKAEFYVHVQVGTS